MKGSSIPDFPSLLFLGMALSVSVVQQTSASVSVSLLPSMHGLTQPAQASPELKAKNSGGEREGEGKGV